MKIAENTVVGLTYELKVSKFEDEIESVPFSVEVRDNEDPFYFIFSKSDLPIKFEEQLLGKEVGNSFNFMLDAEDAYGVHDEELVLTLSKSQFSEENGFTSEMLEEGNFLPLMDDEGNSLQAKVIKDLGDDLILDFNHSLVGFDLHFDGEVMDVRKATREELADGLAENRPVKANTNK